MEFGVSHLRLFCHAFSARYGVVFRPCILHLVGHHHTYQALSVSRLRHQLRLTGNEIGGGGMGFGGGGLEVVSAVNDDHEGIWVSISQYGKEALHVTTLSSFGCFSVFSNCSRWRSSTITWSEHIGGRCQRSV
ncbi:hypothetical protein VTJ04DRAFT_2518 [Mycothermus thermophilus]|uniref:uncharacterized protein n=1 Tax=Humicola insolens TaxID=85995 RepID=UPI003744AA65